MATDALGMLLGTLAIVLTLALFVTRDAMLGFPTAIFWAILSGFAYTQSATTWDIHYFLFFGAIGMAIFSMYAMYGLREKRDTLGDQSMEKGDGRYIDEGNGRRGQRTQKRDVETEMGTNTEEDDEFDTAARPTERQRRLRGRTPQQKGQGEFRW